MPVYQFVYLGMKKLEQLEEIDVVSRMYYLIKKTYKRGFRLLAII